MEDELEQADEQNYFPWRDYARRRAAAEAEADALVRFHRDIMECFREWRDLNWALYHACKNAVIHFGDVLTDTEWADIMDGYDTAEENINVAIVVLDAWRSADPRDVLTIFRTRRAA